MKSTQAMRDRIRELSAPERDDYDRAVLCVLDDLEALLRPRPLDHSGHKDYCTKDRCYCGSQ